MICLLGSTIAFFEIGRLEGRNSPSSRPSSACSTRRHGAGGRKQVTEPLESAIQRCRRSRRSARARWSITPGRTATPAMCTADMGRAQQDRRCPGRPAPGIGPPQVNDDFGDVYGIFMRRRRTDAQGAARPRTCAAPLLTADGVGRWKSRACRRAHPRRSAQLAAPGVAPTDRATWPIPMLVDAGGAVPATFIRLAQRRLRFPRRLRAARPQR